MVVDVVAIGITDRNDRADVPLVVLDEASTEFEYVHQAVQRPVIRPGPLRTGERRSGMRIRRGRETIVTLRPRARRGLAVVT